MPGNLRNVQIQYNRLWDLDIVSMHIRFIANLQPTNEFVVL